MTSTATSTQERIKIVITQDSMSASVIFRISATDDQPFTTDEIMGELKKLDIVFGIDEDEINKALEQVAQNKPYKIVTGKAAEKGIDSQFTYNFETDLQLQPKEDEDGNIDYHDMNFIQNTTKDFVLATKTAPSQGACGKNIFGKEIQGSPGRDVPFKSGANTIVSDDGLKLTSEANGAIVYQHGTVAVQDVLVIRGDVDFNVGNIDCRGSVRVSGTVKTGFSLTVDGDLEISGNVEDASIKCGGNVLVKGGFFGAGGGKIIADGDISIKYTEGQKMESGGEISVSGEIINCQVLAKKNVIVSGKRGKIIGGDVKAGTEIRAAFLGSDAGTATLLTVGFDLELMNRYEEVKSELERLNGDGSRIKDALYALYRIQMDGKLTDDKKQALKKLEAFQKDLPKNMGKLSEEKVELEEKFKKFRDAAIIAEEVLYPGVKASFGIVYREVVDEQTRCKLTSDGNYVSISDLKKE